MIKQEHSFKVIILIVFFSALPVINAAADNDISGTGGDTGARIIAKLAALTQ